MTINFNPKKITFDFYTDEEIEKISVVEIVTSNSFDDFGHSVTGGLYDPRMGPLDIGSNCKTCYLSYFHCPGHFGHISLPVTVYNPLQFINAYKLLRAICLKCKRFNITQYERLINCCKLSLLKTGTPCDGLDELYLLESEEKICEVIDLKLAEAKKNNGDPYHQRIATLTSKIISSATSKSTCVKCGAKAVKYKKTDNMKVLLEFKGVFTHEDYGLESNVITAENAEEIFSQVFENEKDLLEAMYNSTNHKKFFLKKVPVIPNRFRPINYVNGKKYEGFENVKLSKIIKMCAMTVDDPSFLAELQLTVSSCFDNASNYKSAQVFEGYKQVLEKKEGLFRQNIMGKRVNFSGRSVISPDPNLETREIGIPLIFANKLTFPEKVNRTNADKLKKAVLNGTTYPGALFVENERFMLNIQTMADEKRFSIANQLLEGEKTVWRHLQDGDVVLVNRQPTLHRASIMAHKCKILKNEKTLRMHYVNCKPYNADFDGDEMNIHFPQSYLAISEAEHLAMNDYNYLVATNGEPIRGLTQDHIVISSLITMKDSFFTRDQYLTLVNAGLSNRRIKLCKPTILKPVELYTGKQIYTTILKNIGVSLNLKIKTKINNDMWKGHKEEAFVTLKNGCLYTGILDKNSLGPTSYSLIHACGELKGFKVSNDLLTYFGRIVNRYMLMFGFTIGIDDLFLDNEAELNRKRFALEGDLETKLIQRNYMDKNSEYFFSKDKSAQLDSIIREQMNKVTSNIVKSSVPFGLEKEFPKNNMGLVITTGAKGSLVNLSQISGNLGQQELEGRRVPVMLSGKTLPCFKLYENSPSAGGYIFQRFLSGVNPPEFFFHCMAGREGLIDTAVKTANSGYLQRSLIKHLEGLKVEYDGTVRNGQRIIQYVYGEDGLDVSKSKYLFNFDFYNNNRDSFGIGSTKNYTKINEDIKNDFISERFAKHVEDKEQCFREFLYNKYMASLSDAGESVGVIAAQSVGEPSTQMTLNTFHLAGVGAKNVTLGIPRLREIIMMATKIIKTPLITIPIKQNVDAFTNLLKKITLDECVKSFSVDEKIEFREGAYKKVITFTFELEEENLLLAVKALDTKFIKDLGKRIKKLMSGFNITGVTVDEVSHTKAFKQKKENDSSDHETEGNEEGFLDINGESEEESYESETATVTTYPDTVLDGTEPEITRSEKRINFLNFKQIAENTFAFSFYYDSEFNIYIPSLIEDLLPSIVVREFKGIGKATVSGTTLYVEGSNFNSLTSLLRGSNGVPIDLMEYLDIYNSQSNDIYSILEMYGVEAARYAIVHEITNVFDAYGIVIDDRHLFVIADYMTREGEYTPFHRRGLSLDDSAIQRMSYESCYTVIREASIYKSSDSLQNPSARVALGLPVESGTGCFEVFQDLEI